MKQVVYEEDGEEMQCGNYTCETQHGAHTLLMQTAVLQEKHWFENVCLMIRIQLHTTPTPPATY